MKSKARARLLFTDLSNFRCFDIKIMTVNSRQNQPIKLQLGRGRSTRLRFSFHRTSLRNLLLSTSSTQCSPPPPPCCGGRSPHPSKKWHRHDATGGSISSPRAPSWRSLSSSRRRRISRFRSLALRFQRRRGGGDVPAAAALAVALALALPGRRL